MNLPEYLRSFERAYSHYEMTCAEAREQMHKALSVAREEFFEDSEKAVEAEPRRH